MDSDTESATHYRRGTMFGLTVAEIFILLLFLLLLLLAFADKDDGDKRTELERVKNELNELQSWKPVARMFETPEEVVTLKRAKDSAEREAQQHKELADALRNAANSDAAAERVVEEAVAAKQRAEEQAEEAARDAAEAREELRVLRTKGQNPPCWYRQVDDGKGGVRERPYYTFDVGVYADHMVLRRAATPPGGAADDNGGSYAAEADRLDLGNLPYGQPLDDNTFIRTLQPVHDAGKNKLVRTYSCIFWTRVWDLTPPDAKARWQRAHDRILEGMFGAYTVRDDPWSP